MIILIILRYRLLAYLQTKKKNHFNEIEKEFFSMEIYRPFQNE